MDQVDKWSESKVEGKGVEGKGVEGRKRSGE